MNSKLFFLTLVLCSFCFGVFSQVVPQGSLSGNAICPGGLPTLTFTATAGTGPFTVRYTDGNAIRTQTGVTSGSPFNAVSTTTATKTYTLLKVTGSDGGTRNSGFANARGTVRVSARPDLKSLTLSPITPVCAGSNATLSLSGFVQTRNFQSKSSISTVANGAISVYSADLDGDGDMDVLSASVNDDKVAWYKNDGSGGFGPQLIITTSADFATSVHAADLDGDGDLDVLSSSFYDDKIAWYKNDGSGGFGPQLVISSLANGANSVYAADLDGDGDLDVLSASLNDNKVAWYENNGSGGFGTPILISQPLETKSPQSVYASDLDGDGDMDVLSASSLDDKIAWYQNNGSGGFGPQNIISTAANGAAFVSAADLDGDGYMDVLSASQEDNKVAWYRNNRSGGFGTQNVISSVAAGTASVHAADLDNDGDLDVLSASGGDNKVAWYENDGSGGFGAQIVINSNNLTGFPYSVFAADLDGDGDLDVPVAAYQSDKIEWYENRTPLSGNASVSYQLNSGSTQTVPITVSSGSASAVIASPVSGTLQLSKISAVNGCETAITIATSLSVDPVSVGGTVSSAQTICTGTSPADLTLSGQVGNVLKWQKASDAAFSDPVDIASTSTTLTSALMGTLTADTYFRAVVKSGVCSEANSSSVLVTVNPQPVSPTLNIKTPNVASVCFGTSVSATFNAGSGGVGCSDDYVLMIDGGSPVAYSSGALVGATANSSIVIQGRRANCSSGSGCNGTPYVTLASWTVSSQPVSPTLNTKTPNVASVCFGTSVSASFNAGSGGVGCSDDYVVMIDGGSPVAYSSGALVGATANSSIVIQGRRANCSSGSGCNGTSYVTLASWTVNPPPVSPTLNTKTPNVASVCFGTSVSASFNAGSGGVGCSDDYVLMIDGGSPVAYTSGALVGATANSSIVIQGRRANCSSGCNGTTYVTLASWTVSPQPVSPTLNTKTPNVASVCFGTSVSATFNAGSGGCSDDYVVMIDGGSPVAYSSGALVGATANSSIVIQGRRANCSSGSGCNGTTYVTLASWTVNSLPTATISGTTAVCQNSSSPSITFTGANATAPYTFTYKINDGAPQTVKTVSGNSVTVSVPTSVIGVFRYTLVSVSESSSTSCSQLQSGSVEIKVQSKPTITLSTFQQTLNEGNSQTFCDTDANPLNGLQFGVTTGCVVGTLIWRVQVGSGAWSDWSPTAPVSQPSNNQPHRYQAACDASCPATYTSTITVQINYRASTPQQVSLVADGVTVNEGESKEVCNIEGNALIFSATCVSGEVLLYSVDGGDYNSALPTQLVDGQYHNYRIRCRKSDGTASCIETESGVMRLKMTNGLGQVPVASLNVTSGCGTPVSFSGTASCGSLITVWYNASTNVALATLPSQTPTETTSYYAHCQAGGGCLSEKSNVVTYTVIPVGVAPVVTVSSEVVCVGTSVTVSANCPAGSQTFWNTGVTTSSFEISFKNVTKQTYWAKCIFSSGCQSAESLKKEVYWNAFVVTLINIGQTKSAVKSANDKALWSSQIITKDGGPELVQSTQLNPTLYYVENANKTAPRYWTINMDACAFGTEGSLTFDLLATPETGVPQSFNTHENNAPYFMYANRDGWTELYAQNHPAYGFYQDNGAGGNVYDLGLPKGLYKLGIRYWDQKGWGSIYPSTRKPQGNVLAYQEYWFRIQSKDGVGVGAARTADSGQQAAISGEQVAIVPPLGRSAARGRGLTVLPNPVTNILRLQVQDSKGQLVQTTLTDASGRQVLGRDFVPETNTHLEEFGVSELANGVYFLRVQTENGQEILKVLKVK